MQTEPNIIEEWLKAVQTHPKHIDLRYQVIWSNTKDVPIFTLYDQNGKFIGSIGIRHHEFGVGTEGFREYVVSRVNKLIHDAHEHED